MTIANSIASVLKSISDHIGAVTKIAGVLATAVTVICWYSVSLGSWRNHPNGCIEFDLRPTAEGLLFAPDPSVVTKYESGFAILTWVSMRFYTERDGRKTEGGIVTGWVNPITGTLSLKYKIQEIGGRLINGYREDTPIVFERSGKTCSRSGS